MTPTPAPLNSIVIVTMPLLTLSMGYATVDGFWQDPTNPISRRWVRPGRVPVTWSAARGAYVAWDPVRVGHQE